MGGSIDVVMFDWVSVCLLDFDAKLLYGFTVPIKGEGGWGGCEWDMRSELSQPSLAF